MGKPKALRNRDIVPVIVKDQTTSRKRTNFDSVDEPVLISSTENNDDICDEANEPEEVTANSMEVLRMKEMHEKIVESTLKKSKRRKVTAAKSSEHNVDDALDQSIFDSLAQDKEEESDEENDDDEDAPTWKIDVKRSNSRKIDGIEVTVLDTVKELDPINSFRVSDSVKNFSATAYSKNSRVKYMSFVAQKKGGPSKQFVVK